MAALDDDALRSPFDGLSSYSIETIFSSLDAASLLDVQLAARWAHEIGRQNHIWHELCENHLGLTAPPSPYKELHLCEEPVRCWIVQGGAPHFNLQQAYWRLRRSRPWALHYVGTITDGGMDAAETPGAGPRYHFTNLFKPNKWESYCSAAPSNVTCIGACGMGDFEEEKRGRALAAERRIMVAALAYPVHRLLGWAQGVRTLQSLSTNELRGLFLEAAAEAMVVPMMLLGGGPGQAAAIDGDGLGVWGLESGSDYDSDEEVDESADSGRGNRNGIVGIEQLHPDTTLNDGADGGIAELSSIAEFRAFVDVVRERREADTRHASHETDAGGSAAEGGGEGQASSTGGAAAVSASTGGGIGGGDDLTANVQWSDNVKAWHVPPEVSAAVMNVRVSREGEYSCPLKTGAILFSNTGQLPRPDQFPEGRTTPAELLASKGETSPTAGRVGSGAETGDRGWGGTGEGKEKAADGSASGASASHPHAAVLEEAEARSLEGVVKLSEEGRLPPIINITYQRCPVCARQRAVVGQTKTYRTPFPYRGRSYVSEPGTSAGAGTAAGAAAAEEDGALAEAHEDCVTVTLEFARGGKGYGAGSGEFELAAWFQYTCPVACREHCPTEVADRLDIKFKKSRPAKFVAVRLIDSEDRMAELGDNHDDPNIDVAYVAFKGRALRRSENALRSEANRWKKERTAREAEGRSTSTLPVSAST